MIRRSEPDAPTPCSIKDGQLFGVMADSVLASATCKLLEVAPDVWLRVAFWPEPGIRSRAGTVVLAPGRGDFIEKYSETIARVQARGFSVAILDWRGQGGSTRLTINPRKGHVRDFSEYRSDFFSFMRHVVLPETPPPHFGLAYSMAGTILLGLGDYLTTWFERLVLVAPMLKIQNSFVRSEFAGAIARMMELLGMGAKFVPGGGPLALEEREFANNLMTSDIQRFRRTAELLRSFPALGTGAPTVSWYVAALNAMRGLQSPGVIRQIKVPVLIFAPTLDRVVSTLASEHLALLNPVIHTVMLPGARHDVLAERDAILDCFFVGFDNFISNGKIDPPENLERTLGAVSDETSQILQF